MEETGGRGIVVVWWILIITCVALIFAPPWHSWYPQEIEDQEENDRILLVLMEMQGRLLIGVGQTQPDQLETQLVELEIYARSDQTVAAVAALRFFIDPDGNGKERAKALVKRRLENTDDDKNRDIALLELVQKALQEQDPLTEKEEQEVRSKMGWFGKVLLSAGAAEGEPGAKEAASLRVQSLVMMTTTLIVSLSVMGVGLLGVALLAVGLIMMKKGKLVPVGVAPGISGRPYLAAFAIYLLIMTVTDFLSIAVNPFLRVAGMFLSIGVAFLWPRIRGLGWTDTLRGFGWRRGKGIFREIVAGIIGYIAMAPVFAIGLCLTLILVMLSGMLAGHMGEGGGGQSSPVPIAHPILLWIADGAWYIKVAAFILASGLAPLFEETMFRGALYHHLRKGWGIVGAGMINGVIFAAVHPQGLLAIPALTAMGFGFSLIREWRGTLIAPMAAHSVHNGILVATLIMALP